MLISNYYCTYTTDQQYVWWNASINSSSNLDTIFELEMINVNKELNSVWLRAYIDTEDRINSNNKQIFHIYDDNENNVWFGFIDIKEA